MKDENADANETIFVRIVDQNGYRKLTIAKGGTGYPDVKMPKFMNRRVRLEWAEHFRAMATQIERDG